MKHKPVLITGHTLKGRLLEQDDVTPEDVCDIRDNSWYECTWPEHVLVPKYNSDMNYGEIGEGLPSLKYYGHCAVYGGFRPNLSSEIRSKNNNKTLKQYA